MGPPHATLPFGASCTGEEPYPFERVNHVRREHVEPARNDDVGSFGFAFDHRADAGGVAGPCRKPCRTVVGFRSRTLNRWYHHVVDGCSGSSTVQPSAWGRSATVTWQSTVHSKVSIWFVARNTAPSTQAWRGWNPNCRDRLSVELWRQREICQEIPHRRSRGVDLCGDLGRESRQVDHTICSRLVGLTGFVLLSPFRGSALDAASPVRPTLPRRSAPDPTQAPDSSAFRATRAFTPGLDPVSLTA